MTEVENSNLFDIQAIKRGLASLDSDARLRALLHIRQIIDNNGQTDELFDLSSKYITDSDNDCRWQAIIIIGQFMATRQEDIWKIIMTYGSSDNHDMRTAIGTVLLEHFFEDNVNLFNKKLKILRKEIENGNGNLKDTISLCRFHFSDSKHSTQIRRLLKSK